MVETERTLLPEVLPDPTVRPAPGSPRGRARARLEVLMARASAAGAGVMITGCVGFGVVDPIPEPSCWQATGTGATGLVRLTNGELQIVLTPQDPEWYDFDTITVVSGAVVVTENLVADEVALVLTPDVGATEVVIETQLSCTGQGGGDTSSGPQQFTVVLSGLTAEWSQIESAS